MEDHVEKAKIEQRFIFDLQVSAIRPYQISIGKLKLCR